MEQIHLQYVMDFWSVNKGLLSAAVFCCMCLLSVIGHYSKHQYRLQRGYFEIGMLVHALHCIGVIRGMQNGVEGPL